MGKAQKYFFNPEIDAKIFEVYRDKTGDGEVRALAKALGMPRWIIAKRARKIGAYEPRIKEPNWSTEELDILKEYAHLQPEAIRRHLAVNGFDRPTGGIVLKRRRLDLLKNLKGYSSAKLAKCFGIDTHCITNWIDKGYLKAKKRGTARTEKQGGDQWWILKEDVRNFIVESVELIDVHKVNKIWFVDILTQKEASIVMWHCERLRSKTTNNPCDAQKKKSSKICEGCAGPQEIDDIQATIPTPGCNVPECIQPAQHDGMCRLHYLQTKRAVKSTEKKKKQDVPVLRKHSKQEAGNVTAKASCSIEGCERAATSRGMCHKHYQATRVQKKKMTTDKGQIPTTKKANTTPLAQKCTHPCCEKSVHLELLCVQHFFEKRIAKQQTPPAPIIKNKLDQGFVVLTISLRKDYVSCITCARCYDQHNCPSFCQKFTRPVDIRNVYGNRNQAAACQHYWPHGLTREAMAG